MKEEINYRLKWYVVFKEKLIKKSLYGNFILNKS